MGGMRKSDGSKSSKKSMEPSRQEKVARGIQISKQMVSIEHCQRVIMRTRSKTKENAMGGMSQIDGSDSSKKSKKPSPQETLAKLNQEEMRSEEMQRMRMVRAGLNMRKLEQMTPRENMRMVRAGRDEQTFLNSELRKHILPPL